MAQIILGKVKGDKGDKGEQGLQGIQGIQGIQGEPSSVNDIAAVEGNITLTAANILNGATSVAEQINSFASHLSQVFSKVDKIDKDLSTITGASTQQFRGLGFKPKSMMLFYNVQGDSGNKMGVALIGGENNNYNIKLAYNTPRYIDTAGCIYVVGSTSNDYIRGTIILVDDGFDIIWSKTGSGATGTLSIGYLAQTH